MDSYLQATYDEACQAMEEGGVPIGSVLVLDGKIAGRGHNRQKQMNSIIRHAEMDCIDNSVGLSNDDFRRSTIYTSLSPCEMCAGAIVFFGIRRVIIAENQNYKGAEDFLRERGVEVMVLNDAQFIDMLRNFARENPGVWNKGE